ncbi:uncharacterized protein [Littorina saxatilis]|uniref:uncharacterized protein n=1 Tax=Littorina saxatilis TaxID=31220 RepID=UPI0038B4F272
MAGIKKIRTTPYHPSGNPVERWNRTLIGMLRSLEEEKKTDWRKYIKSAVHAYNSCIHSSTGYSPYFLFFGRHPRLPVDLAFGLDLDHRNKTSTRQFVKDLKRQLKQAYENASHQMDKMRRKNKARYDVSARAAELEVGDRVLVRRMGPRLVSKVTDRWEQSVYVVSSKSPNVPVYTVQDESGIGPKRTLHRNLLLPIGVLGDIPTPLEPTPTTPAPNIPKHRMSPLESEPCDEPSEGREIGPFRVIIDRVKNPVYPSSTSPSADDDQAPPSDSDLSVSSENEKSGGNTSDGEVDSDPPPLRRSTRKRRPVEKLNLVHRLDDPLNMAKHKLMSVRSEMCQALESPGLLAVENGVRRCMESLAEICRVLGALGFR